MKYVIAAAALLAIGSGAATTAVAQDRSVQDLFNRCVAQAKQAGWSEQDLSNNRDAARRYVINCMRGGAAGGKKSKKKA